MSGRARIAGRRSTRLLLGIGLGLVAFGLAAYFALGPQLDGRSPARLDPGIGLDLATLVGKTAPVLRLPDAAGRIHAVPVEGRRTLLVFHMGLF